MSPAKSRGVMDVATLGRLGHARAVDHRLGVLQPFFLLVQPRHRRLRQAVEGLAATLAPIARQAIRSSPPDDLMRLAMRTSRDLDPAMNDRSDRLGLRRFRVRPPERFILRLQKRNLDAISAPNLERRQSQQGPPHLSQIQALHPRQPGFEFFRRQTSPPVIPPLCLPQNNGNRYKRVSNCS